MVTLLMVTLMHEKTRSPYPASNQSVVSGEPEMTIKAAAEMKK